jgi:hypothetical protein
MIRNLTCFLRMKIISGTLRWSLTRFRLRLVCGMTIPLGKEIAIHRNRKWWNEMIILNL